MENQSFEFQHPSPSDGSNSLSGLSLPVFYFFIFVFGLIGNAIVIIVAILKKNYRNVTNCYIINLAIADLLFLSLSIPYTTILAMKQTDPFSHTFCQVYTYLTYGLLQATCSSLAVMSIDRYFYIVQSKSKLSWRSPTNAFRICLLIWISSFTIIIPYHIIARLLKPGYTTCGLSEQQNLFVCLFPFCSYYAAPLLVIIICYTNLALHVIRTDRNMAEHMQTTSHQGTVQTKHRRVTRMANTVSENRQIVDILDRYLSSSELRSRVMLSLVQITQRFFDQVIVVTLAFAICWLPIHVIELTKCVNPAGLTRLIDSYPQLLHSIRVFTHALAYLNSCLNPYLYALLNRNFCHDLATVFPCRQTCCKSAETNDKLAKMKVTHSTRKRYLSNSNTADGEENQMIEVLESKQIVVTSESGIQLMNLK